jgi:hypothetical protein
MAVMTSVPGSRRSIDLHIGLQSYLSEGKIKIQANGVSGGVENVESDFLLSSEGRML